MLPSSGYFSHLICPYFEKESCDRIYCHFKHKKIDNFAYTPTPIHLLQKPIDSKPSIPEYKPTPINKLKVTENIEVNDKLDNKIVGDKKNELMIKNGDKKKDNSIDQNTIAQNDKKKVDKSNEDVYENIESKLSSIFDEDTEEDEEEEQNDKKDTTQTSKSTKSSSQKELYNKKDDPLDYFKELDKNLKETRVRRNLQDKEIVNKTKSKQKKVPLISETEQEANPVVKKARIAHKTGDSVTPTINVILPKKSNRISPAQVMFNRFSTIAQNSTDKKPTEAEAKDNSKESLDSNLNAKKRIAHTPSSVKAASGSSSTNKQVLKRPVIPLEVGGKVPSSIRQRYLNLIIDELLKANEEEEAYQKALKEENNVFKRSSSKNTYVNLAVIAIKRIRDSFKTKDS